MKDIFERACFRGNKLTLIFKNFIYELCVIEPNFLSNPVSFKETNHIRHIISSHTVNYTTERYRGTECFGFQVQETKQDGYGRTTTQVKHVSDLSFIRNNTIMRKCTLFTICFKGDPFNLFFSLGPIDLKIKRIERKQC